MNKNKGLAIFAALFCTAIPGAPGAAADASDSVDTVSRDVFADSRHTRSRYERVQAPGSKCRRNGVVWSGGTASRFSDRISPRPVRSRWDRDTDSRIGCAGADAFKRYRVSDQPWIR
jgi:hypothetical protein